MKRVDATLLKVFLCGLPFGAVLAAFGYFHSQGMVERESGFFSLLNAVSGLFIAAWLVFFLFLCLRLAVSESFRDQVLSKITFMKERDEREAVLTGKATKATFFVTLAVLILLFSLSCIQVSVYRVPQDQAVNGKTGMISLGLGFSLFEQGEQDRTASMDRRENIFSYKGLPLSMEAVLLMLIAMQIFSYNCSLRRFMK